MTSAKRAKTSKSVEQGNRAKTSSTKNERANSQNAQIVTVPKTTGKSATTQKASETSSKSQKHPRSTQKSPTSSKSKFEEKTSQKKISTQKKNTVPSKPVKESFSVSKKSSHSNRPSGTTVARKTYTSMKSAKKTSTKPLIEFPTTTWGVDSVISFEATEHLPPPELTSIAGGFVFHNDSVLLANIPGRGWEVIGGRIDLGETPEETFRRESMSQIGVALSHIKMIGIIRIEHLGAEPPNCPYPFPVGYGIQYIGIADELLPFSGSDESLGRSLISYEGFKEHYYDWNEYYEAVFGYACTVYKKWRKKLK